jgi:hypothetical protein
LKLKCQLVINPRSSCTWNDGRHRCLISLCMKAGHHFSRKRARNLKLTTKDLVSAVKQQKINSCANNQTNFIWQNKIAHITGHHVSKCHLAKKYFFFRLAKPSCLFQSSPKCKCRYEVNSILNNGLAFTFA